jgi:hypothetical protein
MIALDLPWWRRIRLTTASGLVLGFVIVGALLIGLGCRLGVICSASNQIALTSINAQVRYQAQNGKVEVVPPAGSRTMNRGDAIDVDDKGEARLRFQDFLTVRVFRRTNILIEGEVDPNAPPIFRYRLKAGTTLNTLNPKSAAKRRVRVTTQWAVIEDQGTEFLAYFDPQTQSTWVVVTAGILKVSAASRDVSVPAGMQTWVEPNKPPEPPRPATRAQVGTLFPLVDVLTNNAVADAAILAAPVIATVTLTPTATSTVTPTGTPSPTVTLTPSETLVPTDTPAPPPDTPTDTPAPPTDTPTDTPIITPTDTPTFTPIITPTDTPTFTPIITPTDTPTFTPTGTPTETPTSTPTDTPTPQLADLTVSSGQPSVTCSKGAGSCTTTVDVTVTNKGSGDAQSFIILVQADPGLSKSTTMTVDGLPAGTSTDLKVAIFTGANCYDPDCSVRVTVDPRNAVPESDEGNNVSERTDIG